MSDSCQLGGRSAQSVCRFGVHTHSPLEELKEHQGKVSAVLSSL